MTELEKQFIRDNYNRLTLRELAKNTKRAMTTITDFLKAEGIKRSSLQANSGHPWRKANRQLENYRQNSKPSE